MTIAAVSGQQDGFTQDSAASVSHAYAGNVTAGSLVAIACAVFPARSFVAGDCTKSAGTATIGTAALDKVLSVGNIAVGIWSAIVTGTGSLTMQVGAAASSYFALGHGEFSGSWDASRVEASNSGSGTATPQASGNMTSAGAALFFGVTGLDASTVNSYTEDAAFTRIFRQHDGASHQPGLIFYRLVGSGTTDSCDTLTTADGAQTYVAAGVVYKEASGGGAAADAYVSMPPLAPARR